MPRHVDPTCKSVLLRRCLGLICIPAACIPLQGHADHSSHAAHLNGGMSWSGPRGHWISNDPKKGCLDRSINQSINQSLVNCPAFQWKIKSALQEWTNSSQLSKSHVDMNLNIYLFVLALPVFSAKKSFQLVLQRQRFLTWSPGIYKSSSVLLVQNTWVISATAHAIHRLLVRALILQLATVKPNKMKLTMQPVPTPSAPHPQHSFPTLPVSEGMVLHMGTLESYVGDL